MLALLSASEGTLEFMTEIILCIKEINRSVGAVHVQVF